LGEDVGCSSLEKELSAEVFELQGEVRWMSLLTLHLVEQEIPLDHTHSIEGGL